MSTQSFSVMIDVSATFCSARQIFISYARDDDEPPPDAPNEKGFVTWLHDQLGYEFRQLGQPRPELWRDRKRIQRGDQFEPDLKEALAKSSVLLVVLSRNWIARDWCKRELDTFITQFPHEDKRSLCERIVIVGKNQVDRAKCSEFLQGQEGYNFFYVDPESKEECEFFYRGKCEDARHRDLLRKLARDLWTRVRGKPPDTEPVRESPPPTGRTVFLAKPASDMRQAYDTLERELAGRGYHVVPDPTIELPTNGPEVIELTDRALAEAELSVHLLGQKSGFVPEEGEEPIVRLQLARAAQHVGRPVSQNDWDRRRFHRIVWAPRTLSGNGVAERKPDEVLTRFGRQVDSDQIVGDTLVGFSQFVIQHLEANAPPLGPRPGPRLEGTCVYVRHQEADSDFAEEVAERLQDAGLSALLPAFDGDEADRRMLHQKYLADCDAVVLCWANASEVWVRSNANELKWDRLGRKAPFHCRSVVAGPPPQQPKRRFRHIPPRTDVDLVIDSTEVSPPPPEVLQPLLQMIKSHDHQ